MFNYSVIIPCYNSSSTIETCLLSVFNQTVLPKEIIVVDDGSTDDSLSKLEILKNSAPNTINFIIISQKNAGPSKARNHGIKIASAEWIAFLDSDDCWIYNKMELQFNTIANDPNIVLCGTLYNISPKNINKSTIISFKKLLFKNFFNTPTVLVKSVVFKTFSFDETQKYSEDYKLWLSLCYKYKCVLINENLAANVINKKIYGDKGLSANLWEMQKGEMSNFYYFFKTKRIGLFLFLTCISFSALKFFKRIIL